MRFFLGGFFWRGFFFWEDFFFLGRFFLGDFLVVFLSVRSCRKISVKITEKSGKRN